MVKFQQTVTLKNVNGTKFSSKDEDLIILTIAKSLAVDTKYVTFLAWGFQKPGRRKLVSSGSVVTATSQVTVPTLIFPSFESSNSLYTYLATKLKTAVSSGTFTSNLNAFATQLGLSSFASCTADSVTVSQPSISQPVVATISEISNSDIVGIACGGAVALVLVLLVLYFNYGMSRKAAKSFSESLHKKMFSPPAGQKVYPFEGGLVDVEIGKVSKELLSVACDEPCKLIVVDDKMTLRDIDLDMEDKLEVRLQTFVIYDKTIQPQSRFIRAPPPPKPIVESIPIFDEEEEMKDSLSVNTEGLESIFPADREELVIDDNTIGDDQMTVDGSVITEFLQQGKDENLGDNNDSLYEEENLVNGSLLSYDGLSQLEAAPASSVDMDDSFSVISEIQMESDAVDRSNFPPAATMDDEDSDEGQADDTMSLLSIPTLAGDSQKLREAVAIDNLEESSVTEDNDNSTIDAQPVAEDKETTALDEIIAAPEENKVIFVLDSSSIDDDLVDTERKFITNVLVPEEPTEESVDSSLIVSPTEPVDSAEDLVVGSEEPIEDLVVAADKPTAESTDELIPEEPMGSTDDLVVPFHEEIVLDDATEPIKVVEKVSEEEDEKKPVDLLIEPPYERPPTPIQNPPVNEIQIVDLFDASERFQEFTLDYASAKEGMISKSKVQSLGSFKSGLRKKNTHRLRPSTVDNSSLLGSRPAVDLEFEANTIIAFGYSLQEMQEVPSALEERQEPKKVPEVPKPVLSRSRTVKPSDNFFNTRAIEVSAISEVEPLPSPPAATALRIDAQSQSLKDPSEPPKSPVEVDADHPPSWSRAVDTGDAYVPGHQASSTSSITKAQQLQMEKEKRAAMEEEARIAREKEKIRLVEFQAAKDAMVAQNKVQSVGFNSLKAGLTKRDVRTSKGVSAMQSSNAEDSDSSLSTTRTFSNRLSEGPTTAASAAKWSTFARPFTTATFNSAVGNSPVPVFRSSQEATAAAGDDDDTSTVDTKPSSLAALLLSGAGIDIKLKPRTYKSRGGRRKAKTITTTTTTTTTTTSSEVNNAHSRDSKSAGDAIFDSYAPDESHAFEVGSGDELKEEFDSRAFPVAWGSGKLVNSKKPSYEPSTGGKGLDSSFASMFFGSRPNSGVKVFPGSIFDDTNDDDDGELLRPTTAFTTEDVDPFALTINSSTANTGGAVSTHSPMLPMDWGHRGADDVLPWLTNVDMIADNSGQEDSSTFIDKNLLKKFELSASEADAVVAYPRDDVESARGNLKWETQEEEVPLTLKRKPNRSRKSKRSKLIIEMDEPVQP